MRYNPLMFIRRFYQSWNAAAFSMPMSALAFAVFAEAFIYTGRRIMKLRILMICTAALLAIVMMMYYRNKIRINKALKHIENIDEYERGGCVDHSWFLESRMLVSDRKHLAQHPVNGISRITLTERNHGRYYLHIEQNNNTYDISLTDKESGERTAAFLKRKNPDAQLVNVTPRGSGSLKELGAEG